MGLRAGSRFGNPLPAGGGSEHAIDNETVATSGSFSSPWLPAGGLSRVRLIQGAATGADITYDLEGSADGGVTAYLIQAAVVGATVVELADPLIRVTARNASAITPETADVSLTS